MVAQVVADFAFNINEGEGLETSFAFPVRVVRFASLQKAYAAHLQQVLKSLRIHPAIAFGNLTNERQILFYQLHGVRLTRSQLTYRFWHWSNLLTKIQTCSIVPYWHPN